jgi:dienelactone hydrolase
MHSCSGITDNTRTWAGRLVGRGYAAVMVDSFGPRNQRSVCENVDSIPARLRAQDADNAAIYLRTLPNIQAERIGIDGFSHGGSTTLWAAIGPEIPVDRGGHPPFRRASLTRPCTHK